MIDGTGFRVNFNYSGGTGVITSLKGISLDNWNSMASGRVTTSYGFYADASIDSATAGWFIYSLSTRPSLFTGEVRVPNDVYGVSWNGNTAVPTKDAVYDKLEVMSAAIAAATPVDASTTVKGIAKMDVDAVSLANPVTVGANSPRVNRDLALDYGNSFATAIITIGANNVRLSVTAPVAVSADATLPANIQLDVKPEGLITIASGKTLTIGSLLEPGDRQIFAGTGNVRFARGAVERLNTAWFTGPVSGADISNALTQFFASLAANGGGRIFIPGGTWTTTGNHAVPSGTVIEGQVMLSNVNTATELKLTAGSRPMFLIGPAIY